jgi:hypothetical protein
VDCKADYIVVVAGATNGDLAVTVCPDPLGLNPSRASLGSWLAGRPCGTPVDRWVVRGITGKRPRGRSPQGRRWLLAY